MEYLPKDDDLKEMWNRLKMSRNQDKMIAIDIVLLIREVERWRESAKDFTDTLNATRRKRDEVKGKLSDSLKEIKMRKKYEEFLKSCIRGGESLDDNKDFEWFCQKYDEHKNMF